MLLAMTVVFPFDGSRKRRNEMTTGKETMGKRIREQRIRIGLTQDQLAKITHIPKPTLSSYENDRVDIKSSIIAELAEVLGTDPNYLILGEKEEDSNSLTTEICSLINKITDQKIQQVLYIQIKALVENPC